MADAHKNFAYSTVATAPSPASSGTSLVVQSGHGTKFPAVPFNATIWPSSGRPLTTNAEIVRVTNISTDTLTIVRTQEGTSARTVVVGDQIAATMTAKSFEDTEQSVEISITQASHGLAVGDVVRFDGANYVKAKADLAANAEVVGIVSIVVTTGIFRMVTGGKISGLSGLTAGTVYFLSASTAGALTATEPTTIGYVSKPLLIADSTTSGYLFNFRGSVISGMSAPFIDELGSDTSTRTLTAANTWEDISNTSLTFTSEIGASYLVLGTLTWRFASTGWARNYIRCVVDGATTGVTPTEIRLSQMSADTGSQAEQYNSTVWFLLEGLASGQHTLKLQTNDNNTGVDREFFWSDVLITQIRGGGGSGGGQADGWTYDDASTWTYATSTTFTVSGDQTAKFSKGTRIKLTQTTVKYFVVAGASFSSGTTTVTIAGGSDYSLANAAITNPYYSYAANPQGYPGWFSYTPTLKAVTSDPTLGSGSTVGGSYSVNGNTVSVRVGFVFGSSGAAAGSGEYYVAAPVGTISVASQRFVGSGFFFQGGTGRVGVCDLDASTERCYFWVDSRTTRVSNSDPAAWSNNHQLHAEFSYENN